jgi:hypothetical protein
MRSGLLHKKKPQKNHKAKSLIIQIWSDEIEKKKSSTAPSGIARSAALKIKETFDF